MNTATTHPCHAAMALLSNGVPLSLLLDLALGPCSEEVFAREAATGPQPRPAKI